MLWVLRPIKWVVQTLSILLFILARSPDSHDFSYTVILFVNHLALLINSRIWHRRYMLLVTWLSHYVSFLFYITMDVIFFLAPAKNEDIPILKGTAQILLKIRLT